MATMLVAPTPEKDAEVIRSEDRNKINIWAGGALVIGIAIVLLHTGFQPAAATALLWSGACLALGGLLGFLFGIPRRAAPIVINQQRSGITAVDSSVGKISTTEEKPAETAKNAAALTTAATGSDKTAAETKAKTLQATPASATNQNSAESNLEQVSDWVTKLLLGAGLTQVEKVPSVFTSWGNHVAIGLGDPAHLQSNEIFATAMIIYFLILGFIAGYLVTKVELGKSLSEPAA